MNMNKWIFQQRVYSGGHFKYAKAKNMFKEVSRKKTNRVKGDTKGCIGEIGKVKSRQKPRGDNIHPKFLYEWRGAVAEPITKLYNYSLSTGVIPTDWKEATIATLFKKGNRSEPGNFRPVSLTSIVCKILESIITDKKLQCRGSTVISSPESTTYFANILYLDCHFI